MPKFPVSLLAYEGRAADLNLNFFLRLVVYGTGSVIELQSFFSCIWFVFAGDFETVKFSASSVKHIVVISRNFSLNLVFYTTHIFGA